MSAASAVAQPPDSGAGPAGSRPQLERLAAVVQQRLRLSDDQSVRLRDVSARYAGRRQALLARERDARRALRAEVQRGDAADQSRVQASLDALLAVQQQRTALVADEQREIAGFLTPTQRAQYLGMQERAFRAAQQFRQRREAALGGGAAMPNDPARAAVQAERRAERQAERRAERAAQQEARRAERLARQGAREGARVGPGPRERGPHGPAPQGGGRPRR